MARPRFHRLPQNLALLTGKGLGSWVADASAETIPNCEFLSVVANSQPLPNKVAQAGRYQSRSSIFFLRFAQVRMI